MSGAAEWERALEHFSDFLDNVLAAVDNGDEIPTAPAPPMPRSAPTVDQQRRFRDLMVQYGAAVEDLTARRQQLAEEIAGVSTSRAGARAYDQQRSVTQTWEG